MLKHAAFAVAILAAGPASALSCLRPEVSSSYDRAHERPEIFVVAVGRLEQNGAINRERPAPAEGQPLELPPYQFPARFEGQLASSAGFVTDRSFDVTVEVDCISVWCGGESLSERGLYFFRSNEDGTYALESDPCGGFFFDNPDDGQLREVIRRMR